MKPIFLRIFILSMILPIFTSCLRITEIKMSFFNFPKDNDIPEYNFKILQFKADGDELIYLSEKLIGKVTPDTSLENITIKLDEETTKLSFELYDDMEKDPLYFITRGLQQILQDNDKSVSYWLNFELLKSDKIRWGVNQNYIQNIEIDKLYTFDFDNNRLYLLKLPNNVERQYIITTQVVTGNIFRVYYNHLEDFFIQTDFMQPLESCQFQWASSSDLFFLFYPEQYTEKNIFTLKIETLN